MQDPRIVSPQVLKAEIQIEGLEKLYKQTLDTVKSGTNNPSVSADELFGELARLSKIVGNLKTLHQKKAFLTGKETTWPVSAEASRLAYVQQIVKSAISG